MSNFIKEWTHKEIELLTRSFRRYSAYVFILKFVLPATALVLAFILFLYPTLSGKAKRIVLTAQKVVVKPNESPVMVKPKFVGMDSNNQPYQLNAARAVQQKVDFVTMEKVVADITLNNGSWVSCVARSGTYDSTRHYINLNGDVITYLVDNNGLTYQATTESAFVDMDNGIMKGDQPVRITSDSGTLEAQKFILERPKQKITFTGQVHVVIFKK